MQAGMTHRTIASPVSLARFSVGGAIVALCLTAPALSKFQDAGYQTGITLAAENREAITPEMRRMILGPLQDELAAGPARQPGARLAASSYQSGLRFGPRPRFNPDPESARPAAARFADSILIARTDTIARNGLSAFAGDEATLAASASGRVSLSLFDSASPDAAFLGFRPEYATSAGRILTGETDPERRMAVRYEGSFDTTGADGIDYGLAPRAGISFTGDGAAVETGATVRLGKYIDTDFDRPAWWFFAGADRQAVMYDPGQGFNMRGALAMEPYAIVGDAQAGVAMRMGAADLSIAYVHRETEYSMPQESWDTQEGFAAFSLTWRH